MKRLMFILATTVAFNVYAVDKPKPTVHQVKHVIKLTTRNLPIQKYFADDDDDEDFHASSRAMIHRRQTALKAKTDITPTEDDVVISDSVRLRLMLARVKAMDAYNKKYVTQNL